MSDTSADDLYADDHELAAVDVYRAHLPYVTESLEQMHEMLEGIVARIVICVRAKEWEMLGNWNHRLQGLEDYSCNR